MTRSLSRSQTHNTRVLRTTLTTTGMRLFEDPELAALADTAARISHEEPGDLVDGLTGKLLVRVEGLAAAIVVATVWPGAALALIIVWMLVANRLQVDMRRADHFVWQSGIRQASYLVQLSTRPEWAKEVRIFGLVGWLGDRFGRRWATVMNQMLIARQVGQRTVIAFLFLVIAAQLVVLVLASRAALDGAIGLGQLTLLVQGLLGMAMLADPSGDQLVEYGASRVPVVLELERAAAAAEGSAPRGAIAAGDRPSRELRVENVSFTYPGRTGSVLDGFSLDIEAGSSLGIVGLNGAGKTTLVKLLMGLETPGRGRITVDGIDLRELDITSWRRNVAAIFQDFVRYELSARDNIGFGNIERLHTVDIDEHLTTAARRVGADTVLAGLPAGLDTPLSRRFPGGVDLSGGQWQRIALARAASAVESGARVLVLDEPTAQLDVRAEAEVYDHFLDLTKGLTTIVISHRFSTVRRADRIVVLDAGAIVEDGSHDELVATGGSYARLFAKQAMRYRDDENGENHV